MAELVDEAFLLRRVAYGDSSYIIHVLCRAQGRVCLMARGARRAKSPFRAGLEPLHLLRLHWRPGRTGMGTLADVDRGVPMLPDALGPEGLQLCAVAAGLFQEGDPHGFTELQQAFSVLAGRSRPGSGALGMLAGAWSLLDAQGMLGPLDHCWECGKAGSDLYWHAAECRCADCGGGQQLNLGLRRAIPAIMQSAGVSMGPADLTTWSGMIQDVLRRHGIRPLNMV